MSSTTQKSQHLTVAEYAAAVSSASPTPGGGSVAATVASLAASLAEMVCNLTLAGAKPPANPEALRAAAETSSHLRQQLLDLATADEGAYGSYRAASNLPKSNAVEIEIRKAALEAALIVSTDVPILIAETAIAVLHQLQIAATHGTKHALSDVATGAYLAQASVRSSLLNVEVNAKLIRNESLSASYLETAKSLESNASELAAAILTTIHSR